ncbi:MAG: biopolymer transporter ExbD [Pseudomonadota bacterium]
MNLRDHRATKAKELDLTGLINIVFLILIFFIVAGTLRPFNESDIELVKTQPDTAGVQAPARVIVRQDGTVILGGDQVIAEGLTDAVERISKPKDGAPFIIVADARLPAKKLLEITRLVRSAGFGDISLLTEKQRSAP